MSSFSNIMQCKRGLIMGVANNRSIAFGIAKAFKQQGAEIALSYQNKKFLKHVKKVANELECTTLFECNVADNSNIDRMFNKLKEKWGVIDFVVHALAFSNKDELVGRYVNTTSKNFDITMNISCYSFTAIAQRAEKLMPNGGALLTLTYYGAERVMPHYNVMGVAKAALEASVRYLAVDLGENQIRVNSISAGPIRTLASAGISDFKHILKWNQYNSPLQRSVSIDEIGNSALYLCSDLGTAITGETHHVDCGYHVIGMKQVKAPDISTVELKKN